MFVAFQNIQAHQIYPRYQEIKTCFALHPRNEVFNWMCYLLAAITVTPRGMDGDRGEKKHMKEERCLVCLLADSRASVFRKAYCVFPVSNMAVAVIDRDMIAAVNKRCRLYTERWARNEFLKTINHKTRGRRRKKKRESSEPWTSFELDYRWISRDAVWFFFFPPLS